MATQIVVEVYLYEADTPEQAEREAREDNSHREHHTFVYAASSLDDLPHPAQIEDIREAYGQ